LVPPLFSGLRKWFPRAGTAPTKGRTTWGWIPISSLFNKAGKGWRKWRLVAATLVMGEEKSWIDGLTCSQLHRKRVAE